MSSIHLVTTSTTKSATWSCKSHVQYSRVAHSLPIPYPHFFLISSAQPVVILNASKYSCAAFVLFVDRDPEHVPLESVTREELILKLRRLIKLAKSTDMMKELQYFFENTGTWLL